MNFQEYTKLAERSDIQDYTEQGERASSFAHSLHGAIGLVGESAELLDTIKKYVYYGKPLDRTNIKEEIGDVMWFVALLCRTLQIDFDECLVSNIEKLKIRFPEKFSQDEAINRDLEKERQALESSY